ncbi:MAG: PKD domain-containing protein, partial [Actinomycetota bacterium]
VSRVVVPLTEDLQIFVDGVNGLVASGGGDYPEAVYSGLFTAFDQLDWRLNASKVAILIGDAPAKDPEPNTGYTLDQMAARALEVDPVNVYPIAIGSGPVASFQAIADATSGVLLQSTASNLGETILEAINARATAPLALLRPDFYIAQPGMEITFSAADSFDPDADLVLYQWDFEADGIVDLETTEPQAVHAYAQPYDGLMSLTVISSDGETGNAVASVFVAEDPMTQLLPAAPSNVQADAGFETGRVEVSWSPSPSEEIGTYRLYGTDGSFLTAVSGDRTSVSVIGLPAGASVVIGVAAIGRYGPSETALSNPVVVPGDSVIPARVDILPDSDTNPIRANRKGVLPVALLGSPDFDVTQVDLGSLMFGPAAAVPAHDLSNGGHIEDVDGDGFDDLVLHFNFVSSGIQLGDVEACLKGALIDGRQFAGCDTITVSG